MKLRQLISDATAVLGSYNWTDSGASGNNENTLFIHDTALAQAADATGQRTWSALDSDRLCVWYQTFLGIGF